jgi:hypothetical protein
MILSLLLAVCGCSNGLNPQEETDISGTGETLQIPDTEQENTGNTEPVTSGENAENDIEPPEVLPPEILPPETEPPEEQPPVIPPPTAPTENNFILINELRTEFSNTTKRAEYIEFKITKAGNLNGISLHIMFDAKNPFIYYFPNIDVAIGEYITLHLRTIDNNCINELGDNLSLSGGIDSCPTARDLWIEGSNKILHKTDIVYLQDENGNILDAIIMNESPSISWNKSQSHFQEIAEYLFNAGAWETENGEKPTAYDAVDTSSVGQSIYRSICRYEWRQNHSNTTDWYLAATANGATPGLPNK